MRKALRSSRRSHQKHQKGNRKLRSQEYKSHKSSKSHKARLENKKKTKNSLPHSNSHGRSIVRGEDTMLWLLTHAVTFCLLPLWMEHGGFCASSKSSTGGRRAGNKQVYCAHLTVKKEVGGAVATCPAVHQLASILSFCFSVGVRVLECQYDWKVCKLESSLASDNENGFQKDGHVCFQLWTRHQPCIQRNIASFHASWCQFLLSGPPLGQHVPQWLQILRP